MKFGDKLILLRKKKGFSQEELAEKLGVSRQSVSKWESNSTYPETDKIVQICNLFECSMDDLINDKITDIEQIERVNKNSLNEAWDSLLDFITKTINMFSHMKFSSGMKCIIEMIIVGFLLSFLGYVISQAISSVISRLFSFLNPNTVYMIREFLASLLNCIWFVLAIIILVHTFKIRYLNYYDDSSKEQDTNKDLSYKVETEKREKVIVRDEKDKPFAFLGILSKGIIYFIKFIVAWISIGIAGSVIGFVILSFLSIFMIPIHMFFLGLSLSFIAVTIILSILLLVGIYFIFSKDVPIKVYGILFIGALVLFGVGIGFSVTSFKNIEFVRDTDSKHYKSEKVTIDYQDDLVIQSYDQNTYRYQIDSSMEDGKITIMMDIDSRYEVIHEHYSLEDQMNVFNINHEFDGNFKEFYLDFVRDLKKNKIFLHDNSIHPITIQANEKTIHQLIDNLKKLYLVEETINDQTITIQQHQSKVYFPNGHYTSYDARSDTLIKDEDVVCDRSIQNTEWGERILYSCHEEDYED